MNDYIVFFALNNEVNHRYISCNTPEKAKWAVKVKHPEATGVDVFDAKEYDEWVESLMVSDEAAYNV